MAVSKEVKAQIKAALRFESREAFLASAEGLVARGVIKGAMVETNDQAPNSNWYAGKTFLFETFSFVCADYGTYGKDECSVLV